jgi:hypothetical protein
LTTKEEPRVMPVTCTVSMVLLGTSLLLIDDDLVEPVNLGG